MNLPRILVICTHNSARSQMAEGLFRALAGDRFDVASAGTEATFVRPEAIRVMAEQGIDIRDQHSKTLTRFLGESFAWVITVCDQVREACPVFPGAERTLHWSVDDPSQVDGSEAARLEAYRRAAADLGDRIRAFLAELDIGDGGAVDREAAAASVDRPRSSTGDHA